MALINCPECGREGVSDTANACPRCGFNIEKYIKMQSEPKLEIPQEDIQSQEEVQTKQTDVNQNEDKTSPDESQSNPLGCCLSLCFSFITFYLFVPMVKGIIPIWLGIILQLISAILAHYVFVKLDPEGYVEGVRYNEQKRQKRNYAPECPVCHSPRTCKISMIGKSVSVEMWGLASDSIGKQYICQDCHHKW